MILPSGYLLHSHGKSAFLIGKPSIKGPFPMGMWNNVSVRQGTKLWRVLTSVSDFFKAPLKQIPGPLNIYPLVICYIAMENGPFIVDLPIKDCDFPVRNVKLPEGKTPFSYGFLWFSYGFPIKTSSVRFSKKHWQHLRQTAACRTLLIAGVAVSSVGTSGSRGSKDSRLTWTVLSLQRSCPVNGSEHVGLIFPMIASHFNRDNDH